jgi:YidC/Oxa1 family membrane protein insertase
MYIGPVLTLMFSFQLPAGVGLYWIAGYVFQIFQQLYINKYVMKKKEVT